MSSCHISSSHKSQFLVPDLIMSFQVATIQIWAFTLWQWAWVNPSLLATTHTVRGWTCTTLALQSACSLIVWTPRCRTPIVLGKCGTNPNRARWAWRASGWPTCWAQDWPVWRYIHIHTCTCMLYIIRTWNCSLYCTVQDTYASLQLQTPTTPTWESGWTNVLLGKHEQSMTPGHSM